ncbi:unnamed protein product [Staurois parvus]|uniref:Uncharacterized protein n=1 Tax=Staurois parvus TaxID=386267 RepID=A0ABN9E2P2_9NEOB|nr:unnamed protein product [Staurois parvus]
MLVILTMELKGLILCNCVKRMFDPVFSDPPLLPHFPFNLLIEHNFGDTVHVQFGVYC